ncbi:hypothetical protein FQA39_LY11208 [Lamprigera yunnana]|nr:hypothetical protein FQA39_LY11208 [Lamprigera yunnana]
MKALLILGFLVISINAIRIPTESRPEVSEVSNFHGASPVAYHVVTRQAGHRHYKKLNNENEEESGYKRGLQVEDALYRKSLPTFERHSAPRRKLGYKSAAAPVQFLHEVTPTTSTLFEERDPFVQVPNTHSPEAEDAQEIEQEEENQAESKTDIQNVEFVLVQPDFSAVLSKEALLSGQYHDVNKDTLVVNGIRYQKQDDNTQQKVFSFKNDDRAFPARTIKENQEYREPQTHRQALSFRENLNIPNNQLSRQLSTLKRINYLHFPALNHRDKLQLAQFPIYLHQEHLVQRQQENAEAETLANTKPTFVEHRANNANKQLNAENNKRLSQPNFFYSSRRSGFVPYTSHQFVPKSKERSVQVFQEGQEAEDQ